jgi:hypothetical protein
MFNKSLFNPNIPYHGPGVFALPLNRRVAYADERIAHIVGNVANRERLGPVVVVDGETYTFDAYAELLAAAYPGRNTINN